MLRMNDETNNEKCPAIGGRKEGEGEQQQPSVTLVAKWGKERIELSSLSPSTTIGEVKTMLTERTGVLPKRQKLIGLTVKPQASVASTASANGAKGSLSDCVALSDLKVKPQKKSSSSSSFVVISHQFILMGTPEEKIFVDPDEKDDLPEVVDDFDLDFTAGSEKVRVQIRLAKIKDLN
mmetsp:Transcript_24791/g.36052  ORF Transcript_24791/g.36052 Transcript_24791/m.36052 type:complete len:179 (+) Transcript_24791:142-678(+)